MYNPIKVLEQLIQNINDDTYFLTRDDIDSIECRLRDIQKIIKSIYSKKGKEFK